MQINKSKILDVIKEDVHGIEFYTKETLNDLFLLVENVYKQLKIDECKSIEEKIFRINNYLRDNNKAKKEYFNFYENNIPLSKDFYIYRTAYSALKFKQSTCIAYTEALRVLLAGINIDSKTVITKLPEEHKLMSHYSCIVKYLKNGKEIYKVLDPERENYCLKHNCDFKDYTNKMIFIEPNNYFCENKLINGGCGLLVKDYLAQRPFNIKGTNNLKHLFNLRRKNGNRWY